MEQRMDPRHLQDDVLQMIPSGVGVYDVTDQTINKVYLNDGYYQMIGARREDRHKYDGTNTIDAIIPEDLPGLIAEAKASILEHRMFRYRFRVLDGDGKDRWIAIRANHVPLSDTTERFFAAYYDIDVLMRTQEKLHENEVLFRETLKYSGTTHFIYYPERHRYEAIALPDQYKKLPEAMDDFPDSFIRFVGMQEADAEEYRRMVRQIDAGAPEAECTVRMRYMGQYSWYRVHCQSVMDADGHVRKAIGTSITVDRYKQAEQDFHEDKLRVKTLQNGLLAVNCVDVTHDRNLDINKTAEISYSETDDSAFYEEAVEAEPGIALQNRDTRAVLLSAALQIPDREQRRQFLQTASHTGMLRLYEAGKREVTLEYRRKTNRGLIWVSTRIALTADPENGNILAFFYTTDINERMIYRKISGRIIKQNFISAAYCDIAEHMLYLRTEAGAERLFQPMPYEEMIRQSLLKYIPEEKKEETAQQFELSVIQKQLEENPVYSVCNVTTEKCMNLPGHPQMRLKSDIFYLDDNRDILVFLQSDVTALFEQEREYQEKQAAALKAAEEANLAKTHFLSRISHDIRTPLGAITSMTAFAREDRNDPEKLSDDLDKIEVSGRFLLSLINDILDISRIDSGNIELHPEPYPPEEYMRSLRNMFQPLCEEKGIRLQMCEGPVAGCILADKVRVNQITLNLVANAVKYTQHGGTVTVTVGSTLNPNQMLDCCIQVKDNGIGMSREFQKRMFEPFSQELDNPWRPADTMGTGLGLSLVRRIVDIMKGSITVQSEPGCGTEITVHLPCPKAEVSDAAAEVKKKVRLQLKGHVLLAEDNPINTEIALRLLQHMGLTVEAVGNGAKALRCFAASQEHTYDLILLDIQMPEMNGYEAAEAIRALPRPDAQQIPILAMTADAFASDIRRCMEAGMNGHIAKPIDPQRLEEELNRWLG